jgi:hypothetical protein
MACNGCANHFAFHHQSPVRAADAEPFAAGTQSRRGYSRMGQPTLATVKRLFALSGNRCAYPDCDTPLVEEGGGKVTGRICHIKAQSVGGPRYDAGQSETERHAFENLILMCPTHHDVIDGDVGIYSVDRLRQLKMYHESSRAAIATPLNASDDIAAKFIARVMSAKLRDSPVVTSVNQFGGQTAHSITNINRQVILNKSYSPAQLTLDTFTIDRSQCVYEEHRLNPSRPFWPEEADPVTVRYIPGGMVGRYGREFSSRVEAEEYGDNLRSKYNHYSFYEGAPHTMFFERSRGRVSENPSNYPVFYISLSNYTNSHVVLSSLNATVHQVQPLPSIGESHVLFPQVMYKVAIESREGAYRTPAVPSLKIESGDATAIHVVLEPKVQMIGGYHWFMSLCFNFGRLSVTTDMFAIVM